MGGFLDICKQCSNIIIPPLDDTLVTDKIKIGETSSFLSPKGAFLLQLHADIHPVFNGKKLL